MSTPYVLFFVVFYMPGLFCNTQPLLICNLYYFYDHNSVPAVDQVHVNFDYDETCIVTCNKECLNINFSSS